MRVHKEIYHARHPCGQPVEYAVAGEVTNYYVYRDNRDMEWRTHYRCTRCRLWVDWLSVCMGYYRCRQCWEGLPVALYSDDLCAACLVKGYKRDARQV